MNQTVRELLKNGREEWNAWRKRHPDAPVLLAKADLSGWDLSGFDLCDAVLDKSRLINTDLRGAWLRGASLRRSMQRGADLRGAQLQAADLSMSDLRKADFSGADLSKADLRGARLVKANLSAAILVRADLLGARLFKARLRDAVLSETVFADATLKDVQGLEHCRHLGPSVIDHRALQCSGDLPLMFLRGCGLPDRLIEYLPSILNQALEYYSCFISYASADQRFADRLYAELQAQGVRCWYAPEDMQIGAKILDTLDEAIRLRDKVLIILSADSLASGWVEDEIVKAFAEERARKHPVVFPIRIDDAVLHTKAAWAVKLRDNRNIGDFSNWKEHDAFQLKFQRLLRDLKQPDVL